MATFDLTKKTISYKDKVSSTGQKITFLGGGDININTTVSYTHLTLPTKRNV